MICVSLGGFIFLFLGSMHSTHRPAGVRRFVFMCWNCRVIKTGVFEPLCLVVVLAQFSDSYRNRCDVVVGQYFSTTLLSHAKNMGFDGNGWRDIFMEHLSTVISIKDVVHIYVYIYICVCCTNSKRAQTSKYGRSVLEELSCFFRGQIWLWLVVVVFFVIFICRQSSY